jgi:hypothetical protein
MTPAKQHVTDVNTQSVNAQSVGSRVPMLLARALGVAALALSATACGGSTGHSSNRFRAGLTSSTKVSTYLLQSALPVDSADWRAWERLRQFETGVMNRGVVRCMANDGFGAPPPAVFSSAGDNTEFPDLPEIARHGFVSPGIPISPNPTKGLSPAKARAYRSALSRCQTLQAHTLDPIGAGWKPLTDSWMNIVAQIDSRRSVQAAVRNFAQCATAAGVPTTSEVDFLSDVDRQTVGLFVEGRRTQADAIERHLGGIFARCFAPVETLRERLRRAQYRAFVATNALQIRELEQGSDAAVLRLGGRYGLSP